MRAIIETTEFEVVLQLQRKTSKPICASILRKQSYFNTQKKLSKQNIEETNNNTSIA